MALSRGWAGLGPKGCRQGSVRSASNDVEDPEMIADEPAGPEGGVRLIPMNPGLEASEVPNAS